eukprot:TRINITY_DN6938_c0_g1_i1.p1 TRINITY_DN6938_c0_g1~~TRINITY_DN6938_c0_g1_i1.p1  ORF type:complete len:229 (+),score=55.19 TRINITY_DN6938_c0_g1_i1:371-1057(+)
MESHSMSEPNLAASTASPPVAHANMSQTPPLTRPVSRKSFLSKAKSEMAVAFASSGIGKSLILTVLPTQTQHLIKCLCEMRDIDAGKGKGKELEDDLIKWMIKLGVEHSSKKISYKEFRPADVPMREAFEKLCEVYEKAYGRSRKPAELQPHFEKIERLFEKSEEMMTELMKAKLDWPPKELALLREVRLKVGTAEFFQRMWSLYPSNQDVVFELYNSIVSYTQFSYY